MCFSNTSGHRSGGCLSLRRLFKLKLEPKSSTKQANPSRKYGQTLNPSDLEKDVDIVSFFIQTFGGTYLFIPHRPI